MDVVSREWRRLVAILKDSLKETIDSYVFLAVLAISALCILVMATVSFEPNPPDEGLTKLTEKFPDGRYEIELPILGKFRVGQELMTWSVKELDDFSSVKKPWEQEYNFVIESKDAVPKGTRVGVVIEAIKEDRRKSERNSKRKSRYAKFDADLETEVTEIQDRNRKRGASQEQTMLEINLAVLRLLEAEANKLTQEDIASFVKDQLETQGNWEVVSVTPLELPEAERTIEIQQKIVVPDKDGEVRTKTQKVSGEVGRYRAKLKAKAGTYRVWPHRAKIFFGAIPLGSSSEPGEFVYRIIYYGVGWFGAPMIMLLACIITAFYIPNMLRKGTIDLLLAKPITRLSLLGYKYLGGLTFMFINTTFLVTGLWIALGLRSGIWEPTFLLLIPILTFQFAMFYAFSTLMAVLTRSPIVCILCCVLMYAVLTAVGLAYGGVNLFRANKDDSPGWFVTSVNVAHGGLPHYNDLFWLAEKQIYVSLVQPGEGKQMELEKSYSHYHWGESIAVTTGWTLALLALAYWRFAVKDY